MKKKTQLLQNHGKLYKSFIQTKYKKGTNRYGIAIDRITFQNNNVCISGHYRCMHRGQHSQGSLMVCILEVHAGHM